jgi:hypothetical protein
MKPESNVHHIALSTDQANPQEEKDTMTHGRETPENQVRLEVVAMIMKQMTLVNKPAEAILVVLTTKFPQN